MKKSPLTLWAQANAEFRNNDFERAIALYDEAFSQANEQLKEHIRFNLDLAIRRNGYRPLSRNALNIGLVPWHQIERDSEHTGGWNSIGHDPYFIVKPRDTARINAGWYRIDFAIKTTLKSNSAGIYPDYGDGFSEECSIHIRYRDSQPSVRVVKFYHDVKLLRFDPFDKLGVFNILNFSIQPLSENQAFAIMLSTVEGDDKDKSKLLSCTNSNDDIYEQYVGKFSSTHTSYAQWIEEVEYPSQPSDHDIINTLESIQAKPLISIVMPTFNTVEKHLRACIESVINQSYPHWELCIADDASPLAHVRQVLEAYKNIDPRIKVAYRKENGHISRASNSALELAKGDYVALLDHDDELPKNALYFVALAINKSPSAQIIYSDEDKIDESGVRHSHHFKSDWNPDLFFSQNYVCHLGVYKRELLNRIGGFRVGVEGSQDQDLLLRCLPHVDGSKIVHIPRVLYHWRAIEGSTALASGEKSYTTEAGLKALRDYFSIANPEVRIEAGLLPNTYRARWPIPEPAPLVSLLIPTRDHRELTETCVRSILDRTTYINYEILILDNGSVEQSTLEFFEQIQHEDKRVRVLRYDYPFNYSAINNFGVQNARGEIIGLINNDIEVISPDWLNEMVSHAIRPDIGCVGAKLYYGNETVQHAGVILGIGGVANHSHLKFNRTDPGYSARLVCLQNYSAVTAACLLIRRLIYNSVAGLDEKNLKIAFNDVDLCLKVRAAGYRNIWTPYAELYHHESISRGKENTPEKIKRFHKEVGFMCTKWGDILNNDPYYNPNLTKDHEDFSLRFENI